MLVSMRLETLAKEVTNVAKDDQNQVTNVGREEIVVWRVIHEGLREFLVRVLAHVSVTLAVQGAKLSISASLKLSLRHRGRLEEGSRRLLIV